MKPIVRHLAAVALFALVTPGLSSAGEVRVMTRNLYLGADLTPVLEASTPEGFVAAVADVLARVAASDFPGRAERLAADIVERRPHAVALQEVYALTLNGATGGAPFRDYLEDLLAALAAQGASYRVAAQVFNLDVRIPMPGIGLVHALDRDVILVRSDIPGWPVAPPSGMCRPSGDGCNFGIVATLASPVGPISIERGFVIAEMLAGTQILRVVNTHLEVPELPRAIQAAQAAELVAVLGAMPQTSGGALVVTGDFNSSPEDEEIPTGSAPIVPPYLQLVRSGLVDLWPLRPWQPAWLDLLPALRSVERGVAAVQTDSLGEGGLLLHQICSIFSVVAPCQRGASPPSVLRRDLRRGRDGGRPPPPAQIRTCRIAAYDVVNHIRCVMWPSQ
jgi:hypothetical protein